MKTLRNLFLFLAIVTIAGCSKNDRTTSNTFYLVTQLGGDTLAIEKVELSGDSLLATAIVRSPKVRESVYGYRRSVGDGVLLRGITTDLLSEDVVGTQMAVRQGDSLHLSINGGDREKLVAAEKDILPFIDMVHWPFELMLRNGYKLAVGATRSQQLWSGTRTFAFEVTKISEDSMTLKHPTRGYMGVTVNENGGLVKLDASQTTRKLTVTRFEAIDFDGLKTRFIEQEQAGKGFGALSGRGMVDKVMGGIHFVIDYGTPSKRGRDIWGKLVPYGERWRTGANKATHFSVDKDIMLDNLPVPAGEYTLFSIPQESTCTLIVNKQTGQNGRSYDESQDLGRVEMTARVLDNPVEVFTIDVVERDGHSYLSLQWDQKAYEVAISSM